MSTTLHAFFGELLDAARLWGDQAGELAAQVGSVDDVDPALLGGRVAPAAQAFLDHWSARLDALRGEAAANAESFGSLADDLFSFDAEAASTLVRLLPYGTDTDVAGL